MSLQTRAGDRKPVDAGSAGMVFGRMLRQLDGKLGRNSNATPPDRKGSSRLRALLRRVGTNQRLRGEVAWVAASKAAEFVMQFALLKLLTNSLGKAGYGEYSLAATALILMTSVVLVPAYEPFLRQFHGAKRNDQSRSAGIFVLRWFAIVTIAVAIVGAAATAPLSRALGIGSLTVLAAALVFLFDRWRFLSLEVLNIQRRRRPWAIQNLMYQATLIGAIAIALTFGSRQASTALFAYAAAAAIFASIGAIPMIRAIVAQPRGEPAPMRSLVWTYGTPFAVLLIFQWIQGFTDRYLLGVLLDSAAAGLYVAAFQACGIPYTLLLRVSHNLLVPIAYQRGVDPSDPRQLWAADRVLLGGLAVQIAVGTAMLGFYALFGPELLILLTNEEFVISRGTLVVLAAGRFAQAISQSLQPVFSVHHALGRMVWFRLIGAVTSAGLCWWMISAYGLFGAALGSATALTLYLVALVFGPKGCFWMVAAARREATRRPPAKDDGASTG